MRDKAKQSGPVSAVSLLTWKRITQMNANSANEQNTIRVQMPVIEGSDEHEDRPNYQDSLLA